MLRGNNMDRYAVSYHGYAHSHIDALCHILYKEQTYNGYARADVNTEKGCTKLGIDNLKNGVVTRGILVDIPRLQKPAVPRTGHGDLRRGSRSVGEEVGREDRAPATRSCCAPDDGRGARSSGRGTSARAPPACTPRSRRGSRRAAWRFSAATRPKT